MQCEKFEARMQELLDERLRPECDAELAAHAANCDECREWLSLQEQLMLGVEPPSVPELPARFAERVVMAALASGDGKVAPARLAAARGSRRHSTTQQLLGVALVVGLLLAVAPVVSWWTNRGDVAQPVADPASPATSVNVGPQLADNAPSPQQPPPSLAVAGPHRPSVALSPAQFATMARGADQLLTGRPAGEMVRNLSSRLTEVPVDDSVEQIPGFGPVATSFYTAIGVVRRPVPVIPENPKLDRPPANQPNGSAEPKPSTGFSAPAWADEVI